MPQPTDFDIEKLRKELLGDLVDDIKDLTAAQKAEAARKLKVEQEAAEAARMQKMVDDATGETKSKLDAALNLIKELDTSYKASIKQGAEAVEKQQETIVGLQEEIKSLLAARDGRSFVGDSIAKALYGTQDAFEDEVEKLVLLSYMMEKDVFETEHGKAHAKAVNGSSSVQMSSEAYETVFSTRIIRDLQKELVVGALFDELPMSSKILTMLVEPDAGRATWVDASKFGTDETVGDEVTGALTEISFKTYKLAAKSFITDETEEDAIFSLLPLLRKRLIEAHAVSIEEAFMSGSGTGQPKGLLKLAVDDSAVVATEAKADGSVLVTAKTISKLRRKLGRHGLKLSKLVLIVSMDAYYDLLEDEEWQDVAQVGNDAVKLQGQVGRIYGLPVVVSEYFPAKAASAEFAVIVYKDNFVMPRQRAVTVERERQAGKQRDAYYVTQRVNLQRYFENGVVSGTYAA
ncbi:phage major capsid protein [Yersinia phage phiR2-01]|uniref:Phage major capsid protein n=1 Tax=Yersinia phage phiR2-01 TaxID=1206557 RepID=I7K2S4_9CAUD|nr:phage major capsid protein [Yersinia phage phiR2-01]CCI88566.1 phage major capsid protein [Yersinia phage phiR2-01]